MEESQLTATPGVLSQELTQRLNEGSQSQDATHIAGDTCWGRLVPLSVDLVTLDMVKDEVRCTCAMPSSPLACPARHAHLTPPRPLAVCDRPLKSLGSHHPRHARLGTALQDHD